VSHTRPVSTSCDFVSPPIPNKRNLPRTEPSPNTSGSTQHMSPQQPLIPSAPLDSTRSMNTAPVQHKMHAGTLFKLRLTRLKLHADKPEHCPLAPTSLRFHNKFDHSPAHANSPCPHKETGQVTGLPNRRGEMVNN